MFAQWMLAFITVIGNREHDQDGDVNGDGNKPLAIWCHLYVSLNSALTWGQVDTYQWLRVVHGMYVHDLAPFYCLTSTVEFLTMLPL